MSDIFSAAGSVASAAISANAIKNATQMQIDALQRQRDFVFNQLTPGVVNDQAKAASIEQAQNRLALQGQIDPALLAGRYAAEGRINEQAGELGKGNVEAVSNAATNAALSSNAGVDANKKALIDAALKELQMGATLPPDVQAELVQTGLERAGQTSGSASANGFGGQILRKVLGTAGVELQMKRQDHAANLLTQAQNLEQSRQQILGTLFPNLSTVQLNSLKANQGVLAQSDSMVPTVGLSGSDVANIWLARVGATNQLAQQSANAAAAGGIGQAQAWQQGMGAALPYASRGVQSAWNSAVTNKGGKDFGDTSELFY